MTLEPFFKVSGSQRFAPFKLKCSFYPKPWSAWGVGPLSPSLTNVPIWLLTGNFKISSR